MFSRILAMLRSADSEVCSTAALAGGFAGGGGGAAAGGLGGGPALDGIRAETEPAVPASFGGTAFRSGTGADFLTGVRGASAFGGGLAALLHGGPWKPCAFQLPHSSSA